MRALNDVATAFNSTRFPHIGLNNSTPTPSLVGIALILVVSICRFWLTSDNFTIKQISDLYSYCKQAYDSVDREKLLKALEVLGIPKRYVSLIKGCNNRTVCRVRFLQETSETFKVKSGLRQGDALSPTLFNLALEKAMREVWDGRKMEVCGERVILAYADGIVIMGETRDEVINTASKLLKASKTIGLRVNEEKTKYLTVARRSPNIDHITVDDYIFKKVEVFKYLGVNINSNNDMHEEINNRISCGNRCYYSIRRLLKSKLLSHNSKTQLYHSYLRPIITYASETWSLTKGDSKRLMTFERKVPRKIYSPKLNAESQTYERRKNQELQELYNRPNIISYIKSKRLEWFGHVWRAN
ncbi:Reverse transcriptase domain [Cinara cedri]|uniref:Reverse transcriptase domain n=1 Tax=Cinara cedri TaxID=506608 RepID=A0A5E4N9V9_9HEMI|nr:Reverse transcriptase domain [Cinara cedri]